MGALGWACLASPALIDERKHRPGTTNSIRAAVAAGIRTQAEQWVWDKLTLILDTVNNTCHYRKSCGCWVNMLVPVATLPHTVLTSQRFFVFLPPLFSAHSSFLTLSSPLENMK